MGLRCAFGALKVFFACSEGSPLLGGSEVSLCHTGVYLGIYLEGRGEKGLGSDVLITQHAIQGGMGSCPS